MKKTLSLIISLIFIITCFTSCGPKPYGGDNERYDLVKIDGQDYLVIKDEAKAKIQEIEDGMIFDGCVIYSGGDYDNADELVDRVKNGKLSDKELAILNHIFTKDSNGIKICDFEDIQVPKLPEEYGDGMVTWNGESYLYIYATPRRGKYGISTRCQINIMPKEMYDELGFSGDLEAKFAENGKDRFTEIKTNEDRTEYYQSNQMGEWKTVWYTITQGESVIQVQEEYKLKDSEGNVVSEDIPTEVSTYGKKGNVYFTITHRKLTQKPTVEWLNQFSIEDYKEA